MANPYVGEIRLVGFQFAPQSWAFCNGQLLSIADYEALFNLIGTTYGGDGQNTFGLPNLQSRVPIHQGTDGSGNTYPLAATGGTEKVSLNANQLGSHSHPFAASSGNAGTPSPAGAYPAVSTADYYVADPNNNVVAFAPNGIVLAGGNGPHNNIMPYQCVNFIISLFGVYPPQS